MINLSKLVIKAIAELEITRAKGTEAIVLEELAKRRKITQKFARLLMIKALKHYKYPLTRTIVDSTMKPDIIKSTAEGHNFYCTNEEINFILTLY